MEGLEILSLSLMLMPTYHLNVFLIFTVLYYFIRQ